MTKRTVKWILLTLIVVILAIGFTRVFSGPEDGWVRDAQGRWVAHGHPAGPPPSPDYHPPLLERALPWTILVIFVLGALVAILTSSRARSSRGELAQQIRMVGTTSTLAWVAALGICVGLVGMLLSHDSVWEPLSNPGVWVLGIAGLVAFTGILGQQMYMVKKVLEAHYDLKRSVNILQDMVEQLSDGGTK